MRPLRFSINVTLDGCIDHRVGIADADLHRNAAENIERADAWRYKEGDEIRVDSLGRIRS